MSFRAAVPCTILLAAALTGCPSKNPPGAAPDAGAVTDSGAAVVAPDAAADAAKAAAPPRDKTLGVAAEGTQALSLDVLGDGRIVALAGGLPFEAKADASLAPLAPYGAMGVLFPDDDVLVGYSGSAFAARGVHGPFDGDVVLTGWRDASVVATIAKDKVAATSSVNTNHVTRFTGRLLGYDWAGDSRRLVWLDDPKAIAPKLPREMLDDVAYVATLPDGSLVVVSTAADAPVRAAVFAPSWHEGDEAARFAGKKYAHCTHVPAADKSIVLKCGNWGPASRLLRVTSTSFEDVLDDVPSNVTAAAVGSDGSVYLTTAGKHEVQHCPARKGACTQIPFPKDFGAARGAHYDTYASDVVDEKGRSWLTLRVDGAAKEYPAPVDAFGLAAHAEDDLWVAVRAGTRVVLLHGGAPKEPAVLPSTTDARVLVRNTRPPQIWTGHCDQIFVQLGKDDGAAWTKRAPEIQKALAAEPSSYESAFQWSLVEGRLADRHVVGAIVARRDVEEKQERMEAAVNKLIVAMTPDPMHTPPAYCTVPVLEKKLFPSE